MEFVTVAIRIKPCQNLIGKSVELVSTDPPVIVVPERQLSFSFDNIFPEHAKQEDVYNKMVQPLVRNIINGYNSTIFAYGQTGTGKTYTIGSDSSYHHNSDAGLITRAINDIMTWEGDQTITTSISFVEIYNEKVYDLLGSNKTALQIKGFNVCGVTKEKVLTPFDAELLLIKGGKNRHTGETKQNVKSSRSHAIFTIYCNVKQLGQETEAKLNLVDLAGSESLKKTGNEGSQLHEGININKGLLCIGQVINALSNNHAHVPYRQSTITTILQDSLNKRNFVTLIACIGTNIEDLSETTQTLDFAQRAKRVKNKPEINSIVGEYAKSCLANVPGTPYKLTNSTPNKFALRTPLNSISLHSNKKRQFTKFNSTSNLSAINDFQASISSMPSTMSIIPELPVSLSPIVKKCIAAAEETFLKRVKNIVTEIMTPLPNRVNSPRISRRSLEREVNKIVRSNMSLRSEFQTFRNEIDSNRDRSKSCLDDDDDAEKENHVDYDHIAESPANVTSPTCVTTKKRASFIVSGNKTPSFKKPFTPMKRIKKGRKSTIAASSPIKLSPLQLKRRSVRISKRISRAKNNEGSFIQDEASFEALNPTTPKINVRRSSRISMRIMNNSRNFNGLCFESPVKRPKKVRGNQKLNNPPLIQNLTGPNRQDEILRMLNGGNVQEISSLHTIGTKYATMICQFRNIRGKFTNISDLQAMPWRGNGYQRFLKANFLDI